MSYTEDLMQMQESIGTIFSAGTVKTSGGKTIGAKGIQRSILKNIEKRIRDSMSFDQVQQSALLASLSEFDMDTQKGKEYAKERLIRSITFSKLTRDIKAGDDIAKGALAMMIRMNSTAQQDVLFQAMETNSGRAYLSTQNTLVDKALKSFLNGEWDANAKDGSTTISISNPDNPKEAVNLGGERNKTVSASEGLRSYTRMVSGVSRGMLERYDVLSGQSEEVVSEGVEKVVTLLKQLVEG